MAKYIPSKKKEKRKEKKLPSRDSFQKQHLVICGIHEENIGKSYTYVWHSSSKSFILLVSYV